MHGLAIHLASRIVALADPGTACMTEDSFLLLRSYYDALALGPRSLRGFDDPVEIYRLLGPKPSVSSDAFRGLGLTRLRGREREMEALRQALSAVEDGFTSVIGVVGAPGTGKSRLCYEFAKWCRARMIPVFEARAHLYGHATPLQPVLQFLRSVFFRITAADDPAIARERIAQHMRDMGPGFESDLPLLNEFLGVAEEEAEIPRRNPRGRRARLLEIVRHMVRHTGAKTSVILIEDLHWLDAASGDFLATLVDAVAGTRTMLLVNYRPSYVAPWMASRALQEIALGDLNAADIGGMVHELVGERPEVQDIAHRIEHLSGGNPFFAEELVRALTANGTIIGTPARFTVGDRAMASALPRTVQAVIGARIDGLSDAQKSLLHLCAIVGKDFPVGVLERIVDAAPRRLEDNLRQLCDAEFLQIQPGLDGPSYAFRHPLIQEVAYRTQLKSRRAPLHAVVARAMASFYERRLDEYSALIAYHYEAAGQLLEAARHSARAAAWISSTDAGQGIQHWHKVRKLMAGVAHSAAADALRTRASAQIAWLGWREGVTAEEAKPYIEEALEWARRSDDSMIPLLLFLEGRINVASGGNADYYVGRVKEALALLNAEGDRGRRATLNAALSHAYGWAGLLNEALEANDKALEDVAAIGSFDQQFLGYSVEHWALSLRGRILARLGRFAEAELCMDSMLSFERKSVDPTVQFIAHVGYLDMAWAHRQPALAQRHSARISDIAERYPNAYLRVFSLACRGIARTIEEDFAAAIDPFAKSLELLRDSKAAMEFEPELVASLAECRLRTGDHAEAIAVAREAVALARSRGSRLPEFRALVIYGVATLATRRGDADTTSALHALDEAEALLALTGAVIYAPLLEQARELSKAL